MRKVRLSRRARVSAAALAVASAAAGCSDRAPSALAPKGPGARHIARLGYILFALAGFVFLIVIGYLAYGLFRRRRDEELRPLFKDATIVVLGGIVMPLVILFTVMGLTVNTLVTLRSSGTVHLEVVGHQYWWEVRYPEANVTTANEIHIPASTPVEIALSSVDVAHSFWVPQLMGKVDLIPGRRNLIELQADHPGTYRGQCAEFCGLEHAKMAFLVIADSPADFTAWLSAQQRPATVPAPAAAATAPLPSSSSHAPPATPSAAPTQPGRSGPTSPTSAAGPRSAPPPSRTRPATWAAGSPTRSRSSPVAGCRRCPCRPTRNSASSSTSGR